MGFWFSPCKKWNGSQIMKEDDGKEGNSISFLSSPPPSRSFAHPIFMRSLTLIPYSLLQNYKETLVMQASTLMKLHTALLVLIF